MILFLYALNATLLLLHEIESAYEREWKLLNLPIKVTGFLLLHIPIVLGLFAGFYLLSVEHEWTPLVAIVAGVCGCIPWLVHEVLVRRDGHFDKVVSKAIIYGNAFAGILLILAGVFGH